MQISSDQFRTAYGKLPYPLRDFLAGEDMANIVSEVGAKYGLHVDTIGVVDRETTNMLLGLIDPAQFVTELKSAGIPDTTITPLVQELNEKVFMPLHTKMQAPGAAADPDAENAAIYLEVAHNLGLSTDSVSVSPPLPINPAPAVRPLVPVQPPYPVTQPIQMTPPPIILPAPQPVLPPIQAPTPQPIAPYIPATPVQTEAHDVRTMASDIQMVKSGGFHSDAVMPPQTFAPIASAPTPAAYVPPTVPKTVAPQTENREALHEILKSYGVDPYREPAE